MRRSGIWPTPTPRRTSSPARLMKRINFLVIMAATSGKLAYAENVATTGAWRMTGSGAS